MKKSYVVLIVVAVIAIALFGWVKSTYNGMVSVEEEATTALANVQSAYQRRADLIPNLVQTVKGYASHEKETLEGVVNARSKATSITLNAENIKEYLSKYRMINDFVEIKSGKIINLSFILTVYLDKAYDKSEVTKRIIDMVYDYMDIRRHMMGEDIFLGDLQKEVSKLDGVINLARMRVFNEVGEDYSEDSTTQPLVDTATCCYDEYEEYMETETGKPEIDLKKSDYMLFSEANSMFEIKNKNKDIKIIVKTRN